MDALYLTIKDSFDAISLILVFIFVLFDIRYPQIKKELEKEIPAEGLLLERKVFRKGLLKFLVDKTLLLIILYAISFYLFLPLLVKIFSVSKFQIWNFDFLLSSFLFVIILIFVFFIWSIILTSLLVKKIIDSK